MHKTKDKCPLCGGLKKQDYTTFTADLKETIVVIRDVPATVCSLCGNEWISDDVAEQIENIVEDAKMKKHLFEVTSYISGGEQRPVQQSRRLSGAGPETHGRGGAQTGQIRHPSL